MNTTKACGLMDKCLRWALLSIPFVLAILINDARAIDAHIAGQAIFSQQTSREFDTEIAYDKDVFDGTSFGYGLSDKGI